MKNERKLKEKLKEKHAVSYLKSKLQDNFLLSLLFEEFSSSFRSTEPVFVEPITPAVDELEPFELLFRFCKLLISFLILELPLPLPLLPGGDSSSLFIVIFGSGTKLKTF